MLAIATMSAEMQAIFFGLAVICFVLAAFGAAFGRVNLVALGLMFFAFIFFWNALAAA